MEAGDKCLTQFEGWKGHKDSLQVESVGSMQFKGVPVI